MLKTPRRLALLLFAATLILNLPILLFARNALRHGVFDVAQGDAPNGQPIKISDGLSVTPLASTPEERRVFQDLSGVVFRYQVHEAVPNQLLWLTVDVWKKGKRVDSIGGLGTGPMPFGDSTVTVSMMPFGKSFADADKVKVVVSSGGSGSRIADNPLKNCLSYGATGAPMTRGDGVPLMATSPRITPGSTVSTEPEDVAIFLRLEQFPFTGLNFPPRIKAETGGA